MYCAINKYLLSLGDKTYTYRIQIYEILRIKLFSRRENLFLRCENIFSRRDNLFSRCENCYKCRSKVLCSQDKSLLYGGVEYFPSLSGYLLPVASTHVRKGWPESCCPVPSGIPPTFSGHNIADK